jgi:3-oxoacyl-[acyl-carrier protein] reductase
VCELTQRTALITGAASGIGAATAVAFARAGANVALGWFPGDPHDVNLVRAAVEATGQRVIAIELDVRSTESVTSFVTTARQALGRVDILVANAGIARAVRSVELTDDAWDEVIDLNLSGVWRCFRAVLPDMLAAGYGRLLATSSVAGTWQSWTEHVHYTASKAGIMGLVKSLAIEVGLHGVTVNAVAPGVIKSPQTLDPSV